MPEIRPNWLYDELRAPEARMSVKAECCVLCGVQHVPLFCFGCYDARKEERLCRGCLAEALRLVNLVRRREPSA